MPRMDSDTSETPELSLAKALIIGDGKIGKTHWLAMAAAAGFKVLYFDGDVARQTIKSLPLEARKNIYLIPCGDRIDQGARTADFWAFMREFTTNSVVKWNDTKGRIMTGKDDDSDEIWVIRPGKMDHTCILGIDSWTSLTESMTLEAAIAHSVDLSEATSAQLRPVYQSSGLKAIQILQIIRAAPCHVITIGHTDEYSHTTKPEGKKVGQIKETELVIDWTKMIPKSTSRPNSLQMAKYFTDVAWMTTNATGSQRFLDFRISDERLSGGHFTERKNPDDEYSFANLVKRIGGTIPPADTIVDHWLTITTKGELKAVSSPSLGAKVLDATQTTQVKSPGMKSLFSKPAS